MDCHAIDPNRINILASAKLFNHRDCRTTVNRIILVSCAHSSIIDSDHCGIFIHQWPTRVYEAAAQEPLVQYIREGKLSHADFLTAEFPVEEASRALQATEEPSAIKTLLRFEGRARS